MRRGGLQLAHSLPPCAYVSFQKCLIFSLPNYLVACFVVGDNFLHVTLQVDAEAVKEMCLRHGHVMTFQAHYPIENMALIRYSCQEEAAVAKKAMHITRVGNVMLLASVATDQEVSYIFI